MQVSEHLKTLVQVIVVVHVIRMLDHVGTQVHQLFRVVLSYHLDNMLRLGFIRVDVDVELAPAHNLSLGSGLESFKFIMVLVVRGSVRVRREHRWVRVRSNRRFVHTVGVFGLWDTEERLHDNLLLLVVDRSAHRLFLAGISRCCSLLRIERLTELFHQVLVVESPVDAEHNDDVFGDEANKVAASVNDWERIVRGAQSHLDVFDRADGFQRHGIFGHKQLSAAIDCLLGDVTSQQGDVLSAKSTIVERFREVVAHGTCHEDSNHHGQEQVDGLCGLEHDDDERIRHPGVASKHCTSCAEDWRHVQ